ncbi:MAG TPA: M20/M25/M40 family metallo-hydrolase [Solirubrobacteraceae bacterium]|jgi:tripeptide aminopeptidase|nr:M20/M25/M40 family metallo-hydrolase [Solirubrobacteraceae bacterium]
MTRAGELERSVLHEDFARLCAVLSPSRGERACADVVRGELVGLGLSVEEDGAARAVGGDCGNLVARVPGTGDGWLVICTHLDTVPPSGPIEPVVVDGGWVNAGDGILGADNKAAVAVALGLARRFAAEPAEVGLELVFTVVEEDALAGAKALDRGGLRSRIGYTFDHASPIGEIVVASPTYYRLVADLSGVAAHAGIRPEDGRSAVLAGARAVASMRLGRLDDETTANVGVFEGGTAANVVPDRCRIVGEARSLDPVKAEQAVTAMVDRLGDAANAPDCECDLDVSVARLFDGYRTRRTAAEVRLAEAALRECGYEPESIVTGGGSDANALIVKGLSCVNLANGTERNHQPDERVSLAALEGMLDVGLALVRRAAEFV